jgi:uncharacterized OB-fold protein
MTSMHPRQMEVGPFRFEHEEWIDVPSSIDDRARPGDPKESLPYWEALQDERVLLHRCHECRRYSYFPVGGCQWCGGDVEYEEVELTATVNTWTYSLLEFGPGMETPYLVVIANPDCEPDLQIMSNLVRCRVSDVRIGMKLKPFFVHSADRSLLFFTPEAPSI